MNAALVLLACCVLCACERRRTESIVAARDPVSSAQTDASAGVVVDAQIEGPVVRQSHTVVVAGVDETWMLRWRTKPRPTCDDDSWYTCPCQGWSFGEQGDLELVRRRPSTHDELLHLTPLFTDRTTAVLPRLDVDRTLDVDPDAGIATDPATVRARAEKRAIVDVMRLADYDHDGRATELVLQVQAGGPCGNTSSIVIGIDRVNPALHVFGTADHPSKPLVSYRRNFWESLLRGTGPKFLETPQITCGDHGAVEEISWEPRVDALGLHVTQHTYACGSSGLAGKRIKSEVL